LTRRTWIWREEEKVCEKGEGEKSFARFSRLFATALRTHFNAVCHAFRLSSGLDVGQDGEERQRSSSASFFVYLS
jgi:hypothetical protein